jgi:alpha-L-fucosidase
MKDYDMQEKIGEIEEVIRKGPYKDDWASLSSYRVPEWYEKLRFGIFIHYGLFTVPAFDTEWYPRMMYVRDSKAYEHHILTYGKHTEFGYKDFIPMFKAENFDADRWAEIFKRSGAQYVIPVAEHHDGFQMYGSELSSYNAVDMGPHKNIIGELKKAVEKAGMIFGTSSHRIEHYFFLGEGRDLDSDIKGEFRRGDMYWPSVKGPKDFDACDGECPPSEEFMQDWLVRTCELVDKYKPSIIYFDWWIQRVELKPYLRKFLAYYYNRSSEWDRVAVVNYKHDAVPFGVAVPDIERGQFAAQKPYRWQSDTAMCFNSWCYTVGNKYKEAKDILCDIIDIASKNGTMLLNIGPKADGTFSDEETEILKEIGEWMSVNHEAIFDTKPYRTFGEGPTAIVEGGFQDGNVKEFSSADFRFLAGKGCIYIIALRPDADGEYNVKSFAKKQGSFNSSIASITNPGKEEKLSFEHLEDGLHIKCKAQGDKPVVFKLEI